MSEEGRQPECAGVTTYDPNDYPPTQRAERYLRESEVRKACARAVAVGSPFDHGARTVARYLGLDLDAQAAADVATADGGTLADHHEQAHGHPHPILQALSQGATAAQVPEHAAPAVGMTATKVDVEAKEVRVSTVPVTPAEAAIFERVVEVQHGLMGGPMKTERVVLGQSSEPPRPSESVAEYHARMERDVLERGGFVPVVEERAPDSDRAGRLTTAQGMAERRCTQCGAPESNHPYRHPFVAVVPIRPTCAHVPPGMAGLCHACRPPAAEVASSRAADEQRREAVRRAVKHMSAERSPTLDIMHCCGSPFPLHRRGCGVAKALEDMVTKPSTPAAMLGEAERTLRAIADRLRTAGFLDAYAATMTAADAAVGARAEADPQKSQK